MIKLKLKVLDGDFTIHKLNANDSIPNNVTRSEFYWIGKTDEELSIVSNSNIFLNSLGKSDSWSLIKLDCILDFTLVGILADIIAILKSALSRYLLLTQITLW